MKNEENTIRGYDALNGFLSNNKFLRSLLLYYKFRANSIEEALDYINSKYSLNTDYMSDEFIVNNVITAVVNKFIPHNYKNLWYKFKNRKREIVEVQQILMYILYVEGFGGKRSLSNIGRVVRNKDHVTVLHAIEAVETLLKVNSKFYELYKHIKIFLILNY